MTKQDQQEQTSLYGELVAQGQQYIKGKGQDQEARAKLIEGANAIEARTMSFIIDGIKRAVQEGIEDSFLLEPSPTKQAYNHETIYIGATKFRFGELSIACTIPTLTSGAKLPTYRRGLQHVINKVEEYVKRIQEETQIKASILTLLTGRLVARVLVEWYDLYHIKESQALRDFLNTVDLQTTTDQITNKAVEYYDNVYKYDQVGQITAGIMGQVFPEVKHISVSDTLSINLDEAVQRDIYSLVPDYRTIYQGKATNTLARMKTRAIDPVQIDLYGNATITDKDFRLFISKYNELISGVRPTAFLLLDAIVITATESNKRETLIRLPLKEYMRLRGLKDIKETRKQVKEDLEALYNISISFTGKERNVKTKKLDTKDFMDMRICDTKGIENGVIFINFGAAFYSLLRSYPVMPYPNEIFTFNLNSNPHSPRLLRRITEHKNMNYSHNGRGDIISVKTLLNACPELPKYSELGEAIQARKRIIDPFERDMDAISSFMWHYCGTKGAEIEPPLTYAEFQEARIKITWLEYPERKHKRQLN